MYIKPVKAEVIKRFRLELTSEHIIAMLNGDANFGELPTVPDNASVTFRTPGGGDWGPTDTDVDGTSPVIVEWETKE